MKKLSGIFTLSIFALGLCAQPVLTYDVHALKTGENNPMTYCEYEEPGDFGTNQTWDFQNLKSIKEFTGTVSEVEDANTSLANTELNEFGVHFYFDVNENGIYQTGYASKDLKTQIVYTQAFEKIRFPFEYSNAYEAPFYGEYITNGEVRGEMDGTANISADAWGTIILPNNTSYDNTLRIRSVKAYTLTFETFEQDIEMVTYRWYNSAHRYPLLVLTEITSTVNGTSSKRTQAAFNTNAVKSVTPVASALAESGATVYPNPSEGVAYLEFMSNEACTAQLSVVDVNGKTIVVSVDVNLISGVNVLALEEYTNGLPEGLYFVRLEQNGVVTNHELSIKR